MSKGTLKEFISNMNPESLERTRKWMEEDIKKDTIQTAAEECAIRYYPHDKFQGELGDSLRFAVMQGYAQAEKDNALTIEDIERLHTFLYAVKNNKSGCFTFTRLSDEQYGEVLRRFNEQRHGNN